MQRWARQASALILGLATLSAVSAETPDLSHPFIGCWESEDTLSREGWTIDPSGWLIGYAANRDEDNTVTFFESMRIERAKDVPDVLVVTGGQDDSTVRFIREETAEGTYRFVNTDHDYPQVITYWPSEGRLDAEISDITGKNKRRFPKAACDVLTP